MPPPTRVDDPCRVQRLFRVRSDLAVMLRDVDAQARQIFSAEGVRWPGLRIISGYRSPSLQAEINPLAPRSLHTRCPALAADLRVGDAPASVTPIEVWAFVATLWKARGGRWGGDFTTPDPNHFDLGFGNAPDHESRL